MLSASEKSVPSRGFRNKGEPRGRVRVPQAGTRRTGQGGENVKPKMAPSRRVAASYETKGWRESRW